MFNEEIKDGFQNLISGKSIEDIMGNKKFKRVENSIDLKLIIKMQ